MWILSADRRGEWSKICSGLIQKPRMAGSGRSTWLKNDARTAFYSTVNYRRIVRESRVFFSAWRSFCQRHSATHSFLYLRSRAFFIALSVSVFSSCSLSLLLDFRRSFLGRFGAKKYLWHGRDNCDSVRLNGLECRSMTPFFWPASMTVVSPCCGQANPTHVWQKRTIKSRKDVAAISVVCACVSSPSMNTSIAPTYSNFFQENQSISVIMSSNWSTNSDCVCQLIRFWSNVQCSSCK